MWSKKGPRYEERERWRKPGGEVFYLVLVLGCGHLGTCIFSLFLLLLHFRTSREGRIGCVWVSELILKGRQQWGLLTNGDFLQWGTGETVGWGEGFRLCGL